MKNQLAKLIALNFDFNDFDNTIEIKPDGINLRGRYNHAKYEKYKALSISEAKDGFAGTDWIDLILADNIVITLFIRS